VRAGEAGRQRLLGQLGLLDREAAGARAGLRGLRGCWAGGAGLPGRRGWVGLEGGKGLRNKEKGFSILVKGFQTIEFKFEFEFQQPKIMHQHECHN
jgi:hypothetical protein